jgi:hypothetical protein
MDYLPDGHFHTVNAEKCHNDTKKVTCPEGQVTIVKRLTL